LKTQASSILLDIGGTYIKSATIDKDQIHPTNVQHFDTPKFAQSMSRFCVIPTLELLKVIDGAINTQKAFLPKSNRIFVSGQMGGYVLQNKQGFEIISWQDERSLDEEFREIRISLDEWLEGSSFLGDTGSELRAGLPFYSLAVTTLSNSYGIINQPFRSIISFVTSYLTDFNANGMHVTDAAASGMMNLSSHQWNDHLTSRVFRELSFPKIYSEVESIGYSRKFEAEVYVGVGDQQASLLGAGIDSKNIVINIGTGGQVAGLNNQTQNPTKFQIRPFFSGQNIRTITHLPSGRALKAFVEYTFGNTGDKEFKAFEELGKQYSDNQHDIDLSDIGAALETLTKLGFKQDAGKISLAFFSGLIKKYKESVDLIDLKGDLVFAGGVGQKVSLVSQEISRLCKKDYRVSAVQETTLEGLGILASSV
jgi:sugar (pentulose or hexulose) kinase